MPSLDAIKARLSSRVWQAIAHGDIETGDMSREQLEPLVEGVIEATMLEMDDLLAEVARTVGARPGQERPAIVQTEEQILWEGRPFLSLNERYMVTSQRVRIITGLLSREAGDIELIRVQDIEHTQTLGERMLSIGDVVVHSVDPSSPNVVLRNVKNPDEVHEIIRRAVLQAREDGKFAFQDEM